MLHINATQVGPVSLWLWVATLHMSSCADNIFSKFEEHVTLCTDSQFLLHYVADAELHATLVTVDIHHCP